MFWSKIGLITIDNFGWISITSESDLKEWRADDMPAILSLNYINKKTDIPCKLSDRKGIIDAYASLASNAGGIAIKINVVDINNIPSIETIMKFPSKNGLYYYIGTITIPFKKFSFAIKIQSVENENTDDREGIILEKLLSGKIVKKNSNGELTGWRVKPLTDSQNSKIQINLSENEKYDKEFPDHPLSVIRNSLKNIKKTIKFDEKLSKYELF